MKTNTRRDFEKRLALIENPIDREAVRFMGGKYLDHLDHEIELLEARRQQNPFCWIKDLFAKKTKMI